MYYKSTKSPKVLTVQNGSPTFQGKFVRNEILVKRINEINNPVELKKLQEALKRLDDRKDGKIYRYIEKWEEYSYGGQFYDDEVGVIIDQDGKELKKELIERHAEIYGSTVHDKDFISKFICSFAPTKPFPKIIRDGEAIRKEILDLLV